MIMDTVENVKWRHESIIQFEKNLILGLILSRKAFISSNFSFRSFESLKFGSKNNQVDYEVSKRREKEKPSSLRGVEVI